METLTKPCLTLNQQNEMTQLFYNGALINFEMLFMAKWWLPSHHQFDPCPPDLTESWQLADRNANSPAWLTNTVFSFLALSHCRLIWRGYKQSLDESDLLELNEEDKAEYWVSAFEKKWREETSHAAGYATTLTSTYGMNNNYYDYHGFRIDTKEKTNQWFFCDWAFIAWVSLQ